MSKSSPGPRASRFDVSVSRPVREVTLIAVVGELDMATAPHLEAHLRDELGAPGCRRLVLDLTGVEFFGSSGVRCLLQAQHDAGPINLRVVPSDVVNAVLRVAAVYDGMCVDRTVDEAVNAPWG